MHYPNATGGGSSTTDYESFTYDAGSLPLTRRLRDASVLSLTYDNLGALAAIDAPSGQQDVYWTRDNLGRTLTALTTIVNSQSIAWTYDALSRPLTETGSLGAVAYQYDAASRLTRITWPDTYYAAYSYDLIGAMTAVRENGATSGAGVLAQYAYDDLGRRTLVQRGNGVNSWYGWNGGSQLTYLLNDLASTSQDQTFTYSTNPIGQLSARNGYNDLYAYTADPALTDGYANNGLNQVTAVNATGVTYDGRGAIASDGTSSWSYDVYSRLTDAGGATLGYDPSGRLGLIDDGSNSRQFLYAGVQAIAELDGSGGLISRYVPGAGLDDYAAYTAGSGGSLTRQWPTTDQMGSVIGLTNGSGAATQINAYDEYGVPASGNAGRFGYAGSVFLTHGGDAPWSMRNRQYHPELGRFLQTDPIGIAGGVNMYAYVGNDPSNLIDPFGLEPNSFPCPTGQDLIPGQCTTPDDCGAGGGTYVPSNNTCVVSSCSSGWFCIFGSDLDPFVWGFGWLTGTGPEWKINLGSTGAIGDLATAPDVERARCEINERASQNGGNASYTDVRGHFGLDDYATANTWVEQYTGTYTMDVYAEGGTTTFIAINRSSLRSALGGTFLPGWAQPPEWNRGSGFNPMSNTYQLYKWKEVTGRPC